MAETVLKSKVRSKRSPAIKSSVVKKTLHRADGKRVKILSLDANSPTFGSDLGMVFRMNVAKAKRENSKIIGKSGSRISKKA
jgi:putative protein kinase ArgK-like GTPase of G3E family